MTRFTDDQIAIWRRDGAVLIDSFFSAEEIAPVYDDFASIYGTRGKTDTAGSALNQTRTGKIGKFRPDQFKNNGDLPMDASVAFNLLPLHPDLIAFAKAALGVQDVYLYQAHTWAKYTGDADYAQPHHCDFPNHTLLVPSDDAAARTLNMIIYITDVTLDSGATAYVPKSKAAQLLGHDNPFETMGDERLQRKLHDIEERAPGPAGSVFAYGIDAYHRGVNLTEPNGYRFTLTASFKAGGNDMIGFSAWPRTYLQPWHLIFNNATPDQLACLGVPRPGDAYWTAETLRRVQNRWPDWDLSPYRMATERA